MAEMDKTEPKFHPGGPEREMDAGRSPLSGSLLNHLEESRLAERQTLERLVREGLAEQRKTRVGKNLFRLFIAVYLVALLVLNLSGHWLDLEGAQGPHVAVVAIEGVIAADEVANAERVIEGMNAAIKDPDTAALILRINSPGGSPVQAGMIFDEIKRLKAEHPDMPIYAALEDICASGGYYVAAAADEIYADKATLVGSIGVIMQNFGLRETIDMLGVESRTLTAGENKNFLDPFQEIPDDERAHAQALLDRIHQQFIQAVEAGRGERLHPGSTPIFTGLIWAGDQAEALGLVDGLGSAEWIAREKVGVENLVDFTEQESLMNRLTDRFVHALASVWAPDLRARLR